MSDVIRLLPDSVANQIAAGEVIQRPSSAIKELVENAIDAGATEVTINIKDAGKTMIQVIDNGCGMSETDARMAFERHATSKIRNADDLFTLHTMGFRGEALPSICAIAEVDVKTRQENASLGTHLIISGSRVELQEPCVCDKGTVITVKKLFFNVPARRKFLKSDSWELSNIVREFERMALVNNRVRMRLDTGSRVIDLRSGNLHQRIVELWKQNLDQQLIPIEVETSMVKIEGYVSRPEFARRRNPLQFLIANGRNMRHPYFHKAILSSYESLIASDTQPCYFLKFTVDPQTIDVNRSPTKDDIKFEYEQQIWPILQASVKAALGKYSAVPSIDFSSDALELKPLRQGEVPTAPKMDIPAGYNPFSPARNQSAASKPGFSSVSSVSNWEKLYEDFKRGDVPQTPAAPQSQAELFADEQRSKDIPSVCMQIASGYIATTSREGLILIDQHRAHVKILYEDYLKRVGSQEVVSQSIMFPESVTLDEAQRAVFADIEPDFRRLGFSLEYESGSTWLINGLPAMLKKGSAADIILRILDSVGEDTANYGRDAAGQTDIAERAALMMARSAAIRKGEKLTPAEMEHLCAELFALPDPAITPNGNRIYQLIDRDQLDKMFS